jgi:hypothetical protein
MALTRFCRVYRSGFEISARRLGRPRINSETGAHLWCMKTSRALTTTDAGHDDVHDGEVDNVVHGAFEASYSIKDLAAELGVPASEPRRAATPRSIGLGHDFAESRSILRSIRRTATVCPRVPSSRPQ